MMGFTWFYRNFHSNGLQTSCAAVPWSVRRNILSSLKSATQALAQLEALR